MPSVAASASLVLAETCQLVQFDPTLLSCAKKRRVEPPGRNCPKETLQKGFLWTLSETEGRGPSATPSCPALACYETGVLRTFEHSVVEVYDKFVRPDSAQSKFPLEISLRGGLPPLR